MDETHGLDLTGAIEIVTCHAEGEVGDVIVGGVEPPPGATLWEQARWIDQDETLRNLVLNEPRGGVFRHVNLLVPSRLPDIDWGFIIMEPCHTPPMSGSNSMCVATVLLETGLVPMVEPMTHVVLEAPAGVVPVRVACSNGAVDSLSLTNVPSFVERRDEILSVPGIGDVRVDTAFGGDSFVIASAADLDVEVCAQNARRLADVGRAICDAANAQWTFEHPTLPDWKHFSFAYLTGPVIEEDGALTSRNACAIKPGKIDRSPTGTGCSAFMAVLHDRGEMNVSDRYVGRSIIDSRFDCSIVEQVSVGDVPAIIPTVRGRAWVFGHSQYFRDPRDPWPNGYRISDTWPSP